MDYPKVRHAHIVPRFYLRRFSTDDRITNHLARNGEARTISIDDAAVRKTFYRRFRPDSTPVDDVEWSLSQLESRIAPILSQIETRWPPSEQEKHALSEFFAYQAVRGPRWKAWHKEQVANSMSKFRTDRTHELESGLVVPVGKELLDELESDLGTETAWLNRMMSVASKLITLFAAMKWDLVAFDDDCIAISDHPIVEWPIGESPRTPLVASGHGVANLLEVRIPVSSSHAIFMSWRPGWDGAEILSGDGAHAAGLNAFTIEQAEAQWMHKPETEPPSGGRIHSSIANAFYPSYDHSVARTSPLRREVQAYLTSIAGEDLELDDDNHPIVKVFRSEA